jgi:hypothetical protein
MNPRYRCPLCGSHGHRPRTLRAVFAETWLFMWREIPPRGRLLVLALWLFAVAQTAPGDLWPVAGCAGLLGSLALTVVITGRR